MLNPWKTSLIGIAALGLGLGATTATAGGPYPPPEKCDFLTGGGFIVRDTGAKGTFGVGGGCKHGQPWGHLEYHDHGTGLNVHWLTITGYLIVSTSGGENDPKRTGGRYICGTARTNQFGDVDFVVGAEDNGEPGVDDRFIIRLRQGAVTVYTTEGDSNKTLGGDGPGGGNIQLHKPNRSTEQQAQMFCPAL
jgi:hypothetical protein